MIIAPFAGLSLLVSVSTGPITDPTTAPEASMSQQQKNAAVQQFVHTATECVAQAVVTDPRLADKTTQGELGDLIVDSMPSCAKPMRAMIDAYDRYFGEGAGEAFFSGPYLDVLPTAVSKRVQQMSAQEPASVKKPASLTAE
jgi:hypothetical protein